MARRQEYREEEPLIESEASNRAEGISIENSPHLAQETALWWTVFFLGTGTLVGWNR